MQLIMQKFDKVKIYKFNKYFKIEINSLKKTNRKIYQNYISYSWFSRRVTVIRGSEKSAA